MDSTNKTKAVALAVALVLHGVAGLGIATMQMKILTPSKITPPLEIEFIKPEPEKLIINNEESPDPTPIETPKPVKQQAARQMSEGAAQPQAVTPPKPVVPPQVFKPTPKLVNEPKPEPKLEPKSEPAPQKPVVDQEKILLQRQAEQAAFEAQERARLEEEKQRQAQELARQQAEQRTREQQAQAAREAAEKEAARQAKLAQEKAQREQAERDKAEQARKDAEAHAKAQAAAQAKAAQGTGKQGDGKDDKTQNDKGGKDDKDNQGGVIGGQDLGTISNASWARKPNFANLNSNEITGNVSTTATLAIDDKGRITAVSGVSTGNKQLDRDIVREIKRARLKPFKKGNNTLSGTATLPINFNLS